MPNERNLEQDIGVVAIARNEGERLRQCLESILTETTAIIYVDSGSTDGSVEWAQSLGIEVVELDDSVPFTAARSRNLGISRLLEIYPHTQFVQFVDGDCKLVKGWLKTAHHNLADNPDVAVVCGRRRERFPKQSIYNRLCDLEWDTPIGEAKTCGGDAMMRVKAFQQVRGYNPTLIAGEEPELCLRIRQQGWKILRIDEEMTLHDARMFHFSQWWKRSRRAGYAYGEGAWLHRKMTEQHWVKESRSIWLWGLIFPCFSLGLAPFTQGLSLLLFNSYLILSYRIYQSQKQQYSRQEAIIYALACVVGKFPQLQGQIQFYLNLIFQRSQQLIEYKVEQPLVSSGSQE